MTNLEELKNMLEGILPGKVHHREAEQAVPPYAVYSEYRKNFFRADNRNVCGWWRVQIDLYSKNKRDPLAERVEHELTARKTPYSRVDVYEPGLKLTRCIFDCEVSDG